MQFIKTDNPEVALILVPWFVPLNQTAEDIYLELRERLEDDPEETWVGLLVEGDKIKLMGIAYCRERDVFIWQARKEKGVTSEQVDAVFDRLKEWTKEQGFDRISAIPNRDYKAFTRRWGFQTNNGEIYLELE